MINFRAIIEVLGKPKEHVDKSIKEYIEKLKTDDNYKVLKCDFADVKKHKDHEEMWAAFAEVEVSTGNLNRVMDFCFDYMPSMVELIEPKEILFKDGEISEVLNDLMAKLHTVDMVAKQVKIENDWMKRNMAGLLKNYILVLLQNQSLTVEQLSGFTGVEAEKLADFLDQLIDEGKVDLKGEAYSVKSHGSQNKEG